MSIFPLSSKDLKTILRWFIWFLSVSFFLYEFFIRVSPSVMVSSIMKTFNTNAEAIGALSAVYFYIYAPMQFPVGLLMDRFGPKHLLPAAVILCGIGAIIFGSAPNFTFLASGRFLMGIGSAFAFVGVLYITSHWLPSSKLALLIGIANSAGMVGAFAGEGPISILEETIGWRYTMFVIGAMGILLSLILFSVIHFAPKEGFEKKKKIQLSKVWDNLKKIVSHSQSWINATIALLFYAPTAGFAGLWGVPFLMNNHHMSQDLAGFASSSVYIGWIFGGPLVGYLSDRFQRRRPFMKVCSILGLVTLTPVLLLTSLPTALIFLLLILFGLFSTAELLNFSHAIELHPDKATGSAVAFTNFVIMLGGAIFQPLAGWLLDLFWSGGFSGTVKNYSYADYQLAMTCFPLCFFLAFFLSFFLKEKGDTKNKLRIF